MRTTEARGELLFPTAFARVGASFLRMVAVSPPRGASMLPSARSKTSASTMHKFRGSITRPVRSLSTLRSFPSRLPGRTDTQDSLPAGGQPLPHGLAPAWVPGEVSASSTSLPPHPGFAWRTGLPIPSPISPWAIRIKAPCSSRRWGPLLVRSQDRSDSSRTMNATWGGVFYARPMRSAANCGTPLLSASKSFGSEV